MSLFPDDTLAPRSGVRHAVIRTAIAVLVLAAASGAGGLLDQANALYGEGRFLPAVKVYKQAARAGENPALCYFNAANAYYQIDSLPQAVVWYRACISGAPDYAKGYLNLAVTYYTLNDMANCISVARRYKELDPSSQKGRLILAYAYRAVGDLAGAALEFENLAREFPEMEEPFVALGEIYRDLDDYTEAERWLAAYPAAGKNADHVYGMLADMREKQGDPARALFFLQKTYERSPKPWTLYRIVTLQQKLGSDLVAYETAREGMLRFADFADIAVLAGNLAFGRQRLVDAEICYSAASRLGSAAAVVGLQNVRALRMGQAE